MQSVAFRVTVIALYSSVLPLQNLYLKNQHKKTILRCTTTTESLHSGCIFSSIVRLYILLKTNYSCRVIKKLKSSLYKRYYDKASNEWRGPSLQPSAWATQLRRNVATVACRWRYCAELTGPGIEPKTSHTDNVHSRIQPTIRLQLKLIKTKSIKSEIII